MRRLRLVGSLKTKVSFAKEPFKRDLNFKEPTNHSHPIATAESAAVLLY